MKTLDTFTRAYIGAALWSSTDNSNEQGGDPLDANYDETDIAAETLQRMAEDCAAFQADNAEDLGACGLSSGRAGFLFWLNRNGHGSGFWDEYSAHQSPAYAEAQSIAMVTRDFSVRDALKLTENDPYHVCQRLSDASKAWGSFDLYVGDDGKIYGS